MKLASGVLAVADFSESSMSKIWADELREHNVEACKYLKIISLSFKTL